MTTAIRLAEHTQRLSGYGDVDHQRRAECVPRRVHARGSTTQLGRLVWRDFMDAPTQFGTVALDLSPNTKLQYGSRLSRQRRERQPVLQRCARGQRLAGFHLPVAVSEFAWTIHPGLFGGRSTTSTATARDGPSGPEYCSTSTATTSAVVPCTLSPLSDRPDESPAGIDRAAQLPCRNVLPWGCITSSEGRRCSSGPWLQGIEPLQPMVIAL